MQEHARDDEPTHWDLMLQTGGLLRTYRLDSPPVELLDRPCTATKIDDHPLRFLRYQGSVNKGLGSVRIVDSGAYHLIDNSTDSFRLDFDGEVLRGQFHLTRVQGNEWEMKPSLNNTDAQ